MSLQQALTRPVPLRTSAAWASFRELATLPVCYGRVKIRPIPYDTDGHFHFLTDHAATVLAVTRNGDTYANIEQHRQADETGRTITLLETGDAMTADDTLTVDLLGRTHPDDGRLLANPADILWDLLANIAGYDLAESRLIEFRAECDAQTAAIRLAGVVDNHQPTLRSTIAEIMQSVGAMWSLSIPTLARLYPVPAFSLSEMIHAEFAGRLDGMGIADSRGYSNQYDESDIVTQLQISYAYDWAQGQHTESVLLSADRQTIERYGERLQEIDARWLTGGALADQLGLRLLPYLARPKWRTTFEAGYGGVVNARNIPAGALVNITHPAAALSGLHIVQSKTTEHATLRTTLAVEGAVGRVPDVEIIQRSQQFGDHEPEVFFTRQGSTAVINTNPNANVSLNGRVIKADINGRAFFPDTPAGTYELIITLPGYDQLGPLSVTIP